MGREMVLLSTWGPFSIATLCDWVDVLRGDPKGKMTPLNKARAIDTWKWQANNWFFNHGNVSCGKIIHLLVVLDELYHKLLAIWVSIIEKIFTICTLL